MQYTIYNIQYLIVKYAIFSSLRDSDVISSIECNGYQSCYVVDAAENAVINTLHCAGYGACWLNVLENVNTVWLTSGGNIAYYSTLVNVEQFFILSGYAFQNSKMYSRGDYNNPEQVTIVLSGMSIHGEFHCAGQDVCTFYWYGDSFEDTFEDITVVCEEQYIVSRCIYRQNNYSWIPDLQTRNSESTITSTGIGITATDDDDDEPEIDTTNGESQLGSESDDDGTDNGNQPGVTEAATSDEDKTNIGYMNDVLIVIITVSIVVIFATIVSILIICRRKKRAADIRKSIRLEQQQMQYVPPQPPLIKRENSGGPTKKNTLTETQTEAVDYNMLLQEHNGKLPGVDSYYE